MTQRASRGETLTNWGLEAILYESCINYESLINYFTSFLFQVVAIRFVPFKRELIDFTIETMDGNSFPVNMVCTNMTNFTKPHLTQGVYFR